MADISEHASKASAKRKEISAEQDTLDALQEKVVASQTKLVGLKSDMSEIEAASAAAGFSVAELHAEPVQEDKPVEPKAVAPHKPRAKASKATK